MKWISTKLKFVFAFVSIVLITGIIINSLFLFSPISFRKDNITPYDWNDYKKPIEIVYYYWDTNAGWKETNIIKNNKEIKFIVSELKKANKVEYRQEDYLIPFDKRGRECKVIIRRVLSKSGYQNMLDFDCFENGDIASIGGSNYIKLTEQLKILLLSRI